MAFKVRRAEADCASSNFKRSLAGRIGHGNPCRPLLSDMLAPGSAVNDAVRAKLDFRQPETDRWQTAMTALTSTCILLGALMVPASAASAQSIFVQGGAAIEHRRFSAETDKSPFD